MDIYRYSVKYRRNVVPARIYRMTVSAYNADDARRLVAIRDPAFLATVATPKRTAKLIPPDPMDEAKARDDLLDGVAHFDWRGHDIEVEVS